MLVCVMSQSVVESEGPLVGFAHHLIVVKKSEIAQLNLEELHEGPLDISHTGGVIEDAGLDIQPCSVRGHGPEEAVEVSAHSRGSETSVLYTRGPPGDSFIFKDGFEAGIFAVIGDKLKPPIFKGV